MASDDEIIEKWKKEKAEPDLKAFSAKHSKQENFDAQFGLNQTELDIRNMLNEARADAVEDTYVTCDFCDASDVKGYHIKALDKAELRICENCFDIPSSIKTKMEDEFRASQTQKIKEGLEKYTDVDFETPQGKKTKSIKKGRMCLDLTRQEYEAFWQKYLKSE